MTRRLLILVCIIGCFTVMGCSRDEATPTVNLLSEEAIYTSMMQEMDVFRPDRKPDYCGVIKSIEGKNVTIVLAEMPSLHQLSPTEQAELEKKGEVVHKRQPLKLTDQVKILNLESNTTIMSFKKQKGSMLVRKLAIADLKSEQVLMAWLDGDKVIYLQVFPRWGQDK